jgi:hypothetical protein
VQIFGGRFDRLIFHIARQGIVEVPLVLIDTEPHGLHVSFGEQWFHLASVGIGECDQGFLGAAQIKGGTIPMHGLLQAFHVAVHVTVQQFQEEAEILWVTLVRGGGHQQVVVGHRGQGFTQAVSEGLLIGTVGAHLVRFVYNDEVPVAAQEAVLGIVDAGDPRDGGDDLVLLLPGV